MSITLEDIKKRLREIGEKATQGPWTPANGGEDVEGDGEMTLTLEDIKRLREIGEKATQGPWQDLNGAVFFVDGPPNQICNLACEINIIAPGPQDNNSMANQTLIMAARNHWTALLDLAENSLKHSCSEDAEEAFYEATKNQGLISF